MNSFYRIITFLLIISMAACAATTPDMSAANDEDKDIGLGGTGMLATTGSGLGGTGIVGEITGYGSIFVNGIEIEYDNKTPFTIDGKTVASQPLEIGDVVEVLTTDANQHTQARMINLRHEVIGKVEAVDPQTFSFTVHGQTVVQAINKWAPPEVGSTVAVSGFRIDAQTILSTRVRPADVKQRLLRTHTELPFKGKTTRWLMQTHVQNGKAVFQLDGAAQVLSLKQQAKENMKNALPIKILQLQKSALGQLQLEQVMEPVGLPRGRSLPVPVQRPGNNIIPGGSPGSVPGSIPGSSPGSMPGPMPGSVRGSTYIHNQAGRYSGG